MKLHWMLGGLILNIGMACGEQGELSPEASRYLIKAAEVCMKVDPNPERWKIVAAMSNHSEYLAAQSPECQSILEEFTKKLDCSQSCMAIQGARWAKSDLAGLRGGCRLASYLADLREHPFSVHPDQELTKFYLSCLEACRLQ